MRAARQQADNATFTLNVPSKISTFMKTGAQLPGLAVGDTRTVGVYPLSIYELLRRNEFFNNYANMYDEFKIDKIKVKLLPTSFTINTNGNYRNLTVYTAWDRTGLNTNQLHGYYDKSRPENNAIYCTIGEDITTYSSAESRTVNPNTNTSITRWLNPKTMGEKGQWLSTSLLKQWFVGYDDESGCFKGIQFNTGDEYAAEINSTASTSNALLKFSAASKENPCYLLEDPAIKFKPTLLIGVFPAVTQAEFTQTPNRIHFNVETEIVCTYRGLRKARVISTTTEQGQNLIVAPKPTAIESNGTYYATSDGFNGYSSVTVAVPDSGGDPPEMQDNRLQFVLNDDVVATALDRIDETSTGLNMTGIIEWPKQPGGVDWSENVVQTNPNKNAKWVDAAVVDVSNVHLAERWTQRSNLSPAAVATSYKNGTTLTTAQYPEDFNFTRNSNLYFDNNSQNNVLVDLRNDYVNCISTKLNIGDITTKTYASEQDEVNAAPILEPGTHGVYVENINVGNNNETKKVVHFTFDLTDGSHTKTTGSGPGVDIQTPLPRLYARSVEGYFDLPQLQPNLRIVQPGTYEFGSFDNNQSNLEFQQVQPNNSSDNIVPIPKSLYLIKKDGSNDSNDSTDPDFSFGTFTVDIPSSPSTYNLNELIIGNYTGDYPIETYHGEEVLDLNENGKYIPYESNNNTDTQIFDSVKEKGKWICVYWNSSLFGAFVFNIGDGSSDSHNYTLKLVNNSRSENLNRIILSVDSNTGDQTTEDIITKGFGSSSGVILPFCLNTILPNNIKDFDDINGSDYELTVTIGDEINPNEDKVIQAEYDSSKFSIQECTYAYNEDVPNEPEPDEEPNSLTKFKKPNHHFK